jgi:hypothetical protein
MEKIAVYLEIGNKRAFAGALEWPGWCRSGRNEQSALQALMDYGSRYAQVLRATHLDFHTPANESTFTIVEKLQGNSTTDFGAPGKIPAYDSKPVDEIVLQRLQGVLRGCWSAFDKAASRSKGKELRKGPRGGGRDLDKIIYHVIDADLAYLNKIGWKNTKGEASNSSNELLLIRQSIIEALNSAVKGELPKKGPRGVLRWSSRYFVRRVAWHVLDHAWEIEDRILM